MDFSIIITSLISCLAVIIPAFLIHKREVLKHKLEVQKYKSQFNKISKENEQNEIKLDFFNRAMDLSRINPIINGVNRLFKETVADRFLILIAINGKEDFNIVSVIFEQHKNNEYKTNAIGTYRNINIDNSYRNMLKKSEHVGVVEIDVSKMEDSILKDFYEYEGVKHSKVRFLARQKIDADNDFLIYSSLATHVDKPFSKRSKTLIKTTYESNIIPNINKVLE